MTTAETNSILLALRKKPGIHHASLAIVDGKGSTLSCSAAGEADPSGREMTPDTPYFIASVTKLYIAAVVLRLARAERLSLDQPLAAFLKRELTYGLHVLDGIDHTPMITLRHLLSHTSGLPDYIEDKPRRGRPFIERILAEDDRDVSLDEICSMVQRELTPHFVPQPFVSGSRSRARYSDTNYRLLIAVIEEVTGQPWPLSLDSELLAPLGLRHTWVAGGEPHDPTPAPAALWDGDVPFSRPRLLASVGDLYSTMSDQIAFMRALTDGQDQDTASIGALMREQWNPLGFDITTPRLPGWPIQYGLGTMRFVLPRWLPPFSRMPVVVGHTGSTGCWLFYCPELDLHLCGNVSQVQAGALPFRTVPRLLRILRNS